MSDNVIEEKEGKIEISRDQARPHFPSREVPGYVDRGDLHFLRSKTKVKRVEMEYVRNTLGQPGSLAKLAKSPSLGSLDLRCRHLEFQDHLAHLSLLILANPPKMSALGSLNSSITAAWAHNPSSTSSSPSAGPSSSSNGASSSAAIAKKRVRRTTNLNSSVPDGAESSERPRSGANTPRRKKPRPDVASKHAPPDLRLSSLGGLTQQIEQLMEIVVLPLLHPEIYQHTGVSRPRGVLLHGVPGGGKTQLVKCLAGVSWFEPWIGQRRRAHG